MTIFTPQTSGEQILSIKLRDVYYGGSRYCIMILSEPYLQKMWTMFERQQAIERLIAQRGDAYILPVHLDVSVLRFRGFPT